MEKSTYPYPLRPSEYIKLAGLQVEGTPLQLSESQRREILDFEESFYVRLGEIKKLTFSEFVFYPAAFVSEKGKRLFEMVYLDPNVEQHVMNFAASKGINWDAQKDKRAIYDNFFEHLLEISDSEENFDAYRKENDLPRMGDVKQKDIEQIFSSLDLTTRPERLIDRINIYSSEWSQEQFRQSFLEAKGDVDLVENPKRLKKVANPEILGRKVERLCGLKSDIKKVRAGMGSEAGEVAEAKKFVLDLYQRYINVVLAGYVEYGEFSEGSQRSRPMERVDHFLNGVGLTTDTSGLFETIPHDLANYCENRLRENPPNETSDFLKYNDFVINADQTKVITDKVLALYGFLEGENPWRSVILERRGGLAVEHDREKGFKEVRIPKDYKRGIVTTLALLAHEIEGHVLRYANKEKAFTGELRIVQEFATGRSGILSEGSAMSLEDEARREMVGMRDPALPYYYVALREKEKGGSFKDCVKASIGARAKREYNMNLEELLADKEKFEKVFDKAYSSTLRIFRRFTDLNDTSGYLPISETLDYIEQELVVNFLLSHPETETLSKLLYVAGIDLYSAGILLKMGFLDLSRVRPPQKIVAKVIWPKIKEKLDQGAGIDEIIAGL